MVLGGGKAGFRNSEGTSGALLWPGAMPSPSHAAQVLLDLGEPGWVGSCEGRGVPDHPGPGRGQEATGQLFCMSSVLGASSWLTGQMGTLGPGDVTPLWWQHWDPSPVPLPPCPAVALLQCGWQGNSPFLNNQLLGGWWLPGWVGGGRGWSGGCGLRLALVQSWVAMFGLSTQ